MPVPAPLPILEIQTRTEHGHTRPFLCLAADGQQYYVKSAGQQGRGVIAEWIAGRLAQAFGLPVPPMTLVKLDPALVQAYGDPDLQPGVAFASRWVPAAREFSPDLVRLCDPEFRRDLLAFDWWLHNDARQTGPTPGHTNLLWLTPSPWQPTQSPQALVIDHHRAFDPRFNPDRFAARHVFHADWVSVANDWVRRAQYTQRFTRLIPLVAGFWREIPPPPLPLSTSLATSPASAPPTGSPTLTLEDIQRVLRRASRADFWWPSTPAVRTPAEHTPLSTAEKRQVHSTTP